MFGAHIMPASYVPCTIFIMAPGAFFVLATLTALQNKFKAIGEKKGKDMSKVGSGCSEDCMNCGQSGCSSRKFYDEDGSDGPVGKVEPKKKSVKKSEEKAEKVEEKAEKVEEKAEAAEEKAEAVEEKAEAAEAKAEAAEEKAETAEEKVDVAESAEQNETEGKEE